MLDFQREIFWFSGRRIVIASWRDRDKDYWRAMVPSHLGKSQNWNSIHGETRNLAVDALKSLFKELCMYEDLNSTMVINGSDTNIAKG